jgi:hypothetical protein
MDLQPLFLQRLWFIVWVLQHERMHPAIAECPHGVEHARSMAVCCLGDAADVFCTTIMVAVGGGIDVP